MIKVERNKEGDGHRCVISGSTGELLDDLSALFHGLVEGAADPEKKPVIVDILLAAIHESGLNNLIEESDEDEDDEEENFIDSDVDQLGKMIDAALREAREKGGEE